MQSQYCACVMAILSSFKVEKQFEKILKEKKGFVLKKTVEDGACLFRAVGKVLTLEAKSRLLEREVKIVSVFLRLANNITFAVQNLVIWTQRHLKCILVGCLGQNYCQTI